MPTTKLGAQRSTPRREEMLLSIWLSDLFVSPTMRDIIRIRFFLAILAVMPASPAGAQTIPDGLITQELERAQTEPDSTTEVVINAPADYVFTFLTTRLHLTVGLCGRRQRMPDFAWNLIIQAHPGQTSYGEGSVRTATMQNGELLVQRFLLMDPPREFAYHTDMQRSTLEAPLQYSVGRYRLTELNERQTRLNVAVTYRATSRLFGFIVRRAFSSALRRDFERAAGIISSAYIEENAS